MTKKTATEKLKEKLNGQRLIRQRKTIRYHLFRLQNQEAGGCDVSDCDEIASLVLAHVKSLKWFDILGGIREFGGKWDMSKTDPFAMVPRDKSLLDEWHSEISPLVKELPLDDQPPADDSGYL